MQLSTAARQGIDQQRSKLAGAENDNPAVKRAIDLAFVAGYREVIWISVGLALLGSVIAYRLIGSKRPPEVLDSALLHKAP
jgi:hypothetical protein